MTKFDEINEIITNNQKFLIIQADNPDADSLASALALESLLGNQGKQVELYCGVDMPSYLKYLPGWDRVEHEVSNDFDASIIVDTSAMSLLDNLNELPQKKRIEEKPTVVLDHHAEVECDISFANIVVNESKNVSTGELIFELAKYSGWEINIEAGEFIATSILADSMGLTTANTSSKTYRIMAELLDIGVNRTKLEELRRDFNKMPEVIFRYKARLMERTEIIEDKLALLVIPQQEINDYSPLYNPGPLVQPEHLQTEGIQISIVLKTYDSGRVTGTIRCNYGLPIAANIAKSFGGGGHEYAAGFKIENGDVNHVKNECIVKVRELLNEGSDETI